MEDSTELAPIITDRGLRLTIPEERFCRAIDQIIPGDGDAYLYTSYVAAFGGDPKDPLLQAEAQLLIRQVRIRGRLEELQAEWVAETGISGRSLLRELKKHLDNYTGDPRLHFRAVQQGMLYLKMVGPKGGAKGEDEDKTADDVQDFIREGGEHRPLPAPSAHDRTSP